MLYLCIVAKGDVPVYEVELSSAGKVHFSHASVTAFFLSNVFLFNFAERGSEPIHRSCGAGHGRLACVVFDIDVSQRGG